MNHINRLLRLAKRAADSKGRYILCFVKHDQGKGKYTASGTIWDGVPGSGGVPFCSEHDTEEEAVAACDDIIARYPGCEAVTIFKDEPFPGVD